MLSALSINTRQIHYIERGATVEMQSERFLAIVHRGSLATYNAFIHCLAQTKQHQVVYMLEPSLAGDTRPLCDELQSRLQRNYATLVSFINAKDGLTAELLAAECITWHQKTYIESGTMESDSNKRHIVIDIVRRGGETDFYKFIECLNNTGQHHVYCLLD